MDLIYTNAQAVDIGVLSAYSFDLSFGASENDFDLILDANGAMLEYGAFVYIENTEYGGVVDGLKVSTNGEKVTFKGRTWHGIINSKVISPDAGVDYFIVSGDANSVLSSLIARLGLTALFTVVDADSGINISRYQFARYCKGYDGIRAMLASVNAKLHIEWKERKVFLSAVPIADYTEAPIDGDIATLTVEKQTQKVNHLICLGKGDLAAREVIHLYSNAFGNIGDIQSFFGLEEIVDTYEYANAQSSEDLRKNGIKKFTELRNKDKASIALLELEGLSYDIGDIVGANEYRTNVNVTESVTQKIVKINNGVVDLNYKTGG